MNVIDRLRKHILVDGFHVVVDPKNSHGSWVVDAETGKEYLDCYSQFASQALGWNHPALLAMRDRLADAALHKLANSDCYSEFFADFVDEFATVTPDFKHHFFVEGGSVGVENALKAAFDWKAKRSGLRAGALTVAHLCDAFHGRTAYSLSLTNTTPEKTEHFPRFDWARLPNPALRCYWREPPGKMDEVERETLERLEQLFRTGNVAAVILEPIQGEGGDNHYRPQFFQKLRALVDRYESMLIFDEVQTGLGLTGKWWAYQHSGVIPDLLCFGKKVQVCGFCSTTKIDSVPDNVFRVSGRINSTWGGNVVDMVRATGIIQAIKEENLLENANRVGIHFLNRLKELEGFGGVEDVRGFGLMLAFDLPTTERRDEVVRKLHDHMLVLKCGHAGIRFRPCLTFSREDADLAAGFVFQALR